MKPPEQHGNGRPTATTLWALLGLGVLVGLCVWFRLDRWLAWAAYRAWYLGWSWGWGWLNAATLGPPKLLWAIFPLQWGVLGYLACLAGKKLVVPLGQRSPRLSRVINLITTLDRYRIDPYDAGRWLLPVSITVWTVLFCTLRFYVPVLAHYASPWCINTDTIHQVGTLLGYVDPTLFPAPDVIGDYYRHAGLPPGHQFVTLAPSVLFGWDPYLQTSKIVGYVQMVLLAITAAFLAWRIQGMVAVWVVLIATTSSALIFNDSWGALARTYAPFLLMLGLTAGVYGRVWLLTAAMWAGAFIYGQVGLLLYPYVMGCLLLPKPMGGCRPHWSWQKRAKAAVVVTAGLLAIALPFALSLKTFNSGHATLSTVFPVHGAESIKNRFFEPLLYFRLVPILFQHHWASLAGVRETVPAAWPLLGLTTMGLILLRHRPEIKRLGLFAITSGVVVILAIVLQPRLYFPERYIKFFSEVFFLATPAVLIAAGQAILTKLALNRLPQAGPLMNRLGPVLSIGLLIAAMLWFGQARSRVGKGCYCVPQQNRPLFTYLASLPKSWHIAGHPDLYATTSMLPVMARHKTFASKGAVCHFFNAYNTLLNHRIEASLNAYYADDLQPVLHLRDHDGVDVLVIEQAYYDHPLITLPQAQRQALMNRIKRHQAPNAPPFYLTTPNVARAIIYKQPNATVLDLHKL
ncbi:MAG: hypothetical protein KC474_05535 [Cyanobacteria bacterium HKST-UBA04]|nr:hypothetical protein [Cyanobacteria bacterium HKST-UBA04]